MTGLLAVTLSLGVPAVDARAQTFGNIDIGVTRKMVVDCGTLVIDSLGFYKRLGLDPTFITVGSAATALQVAAGSLPS